MASIASGDLVLEIRHVDWQHRWICYDISCRWRGRPIFADDVLKRHNDYWNSRQPGSMLANADEQCPFIPFLDHVIATGKADYLTLIDPDLTLAIYPHDGFPYLPSQMKIISMSDEYRAKLNARQTARNAAGGILDDDVAQMIVAFDTYQFESDHYSGDGPALHMLVEWRALKSFAAQLRAEYALFAAQHGITLRNAE